MIKLILVVSISVFQIGLIAKDKTRRPPYLEDPVADRKMIATGFAEAIKNSRWEIGVMEFMDFYEFEASDPDQEMLDKWWLFKTAGFPDPPEELVSAFEDPEFTGPVTFHLEWEDQLKLDEKLKPMLMKALPTNSFRSLGFVVEDGRASLGPPVFKFRTWGDSVWLVVYARLAPKDLADYMEPVAPQEYEDFLTPDNVVNVLAFRRPGILNVESNYEKGVVAVCLESLKKPTHAPVVGMHGSGEAVISDIRQTSLLYRLGGTCLEISSVADRKLFVETLRTDFGREVARIVLGIEEGASVEYFTEKYPY